MHCSANVGPGRRRGGLLRPVGHRQDDAVGRSDAHADRRRRAWLGRARHLQFRRRLLRQDHQAVGARPSRRSSRPRGASARCWKMSCSTPTACRISTTAALTENTRCAYPLDFIANASATGRAGHPKNIIMLTADAFGVMPPIARLTPAQAMYHFLSGYTAKVAGTESGVTEPEATFSTCFGAPFMPRHPSEYGDLLQRADRRARRRLLAGQHRLDRRRLWHRPAHADRGDARPAGRGARRLARRRRASAPIRNFGFEVPVGRSRGVDPRLLDPRRPGPTRRPTTGRRKRWSTCSPPTSRSSKRMSTPQ